MSETKKYLISATIINQAQVVVEAESLGAAVAIAEKLPANHFVTNTEQIQVDHAYPLGEDAQND